MNLSMQAMQALRSADRVAAKVRETWRYWRAIVQRQHRERWRAREAKAVAA